MTTTNFKMVALIILGIALLYLFQLKNSDYNLDRTISACMVAQKKTSKSKFENSRSVYHPHIQTIKHTQQVVKTSSCWSSNINPAI